MPIVKIKKSPYWHARGTLDGEKYFESLRIPHNNKAHPSSKILEAYSAQLDLIRQRRAKKAGGVTDYSQMPVTLDTIEKLYWLDKGAKTIAPSTFAGYKAHWKSLREHIQSFEEVRTYPQIMAYAARRLRTEIPGRNKCYSTKSVRAEIQALYTGWRAAIEFGVPMPRLPKYPDNLLLKKQQNVDPKRKGKRRSARLICRFIAALKKKEASDRAWLVALTGMRFEETTKLGLCTLIRSKKYKGIAGFLVLPEEVTKAKRERLIALIPKTYNIVFRNRKGFTSRNNRKAYESASQALGLANNLHLRDLRVSFATGSVNNGAHQTHLDMVMGHADGTNKIYQKQTKESAAKVALAAAKWLKKGYVKNQKCGLGVESAKILQFPVASN